MDTVLLGVGLYLFLGFLVLTMFEVATGRIRTRIKEASYETQSRLSVSGNYVGSKTAFALTIGALWIFWPFVIYAAIRG